MPISSYTRRGGLLVWVGDDSRRSSGKERNNLILLVVPERGKPR